VPQVEKLVYYVRRNYLSGGGDFLGGVGGLHFSNWHGRNTEYFVMTRMALGMQTYRAGKLLPIPNASPSASPNKKWATD
jgi:hypothetical protein